MKTMEVTMPDRFYFAALATWVALVIGAVVVFGGRYLDKQIPLSEGVVSSDTSARNEVLRTENMVLRDEIASLKEELLIAAR